jgi:hypothetical protein
VAKKDQPNNPAHEIQSAAFRRQIPGFDIAGWNQPADDTGAIILIGRHNATGNCLEPG